MTKSLADKVHLSSRFHNSSESIAIKYCFHRVPLLSILILRSRIYYNLSSALKWELDAWDLRLLRDTCSL